MSYELEPRVSHDLINRQALARVWINHQWDQFFAFSAHIMPLTAFVYSIFFSAAEDGLLVTYIAWVDIAEELVHNEANVEYVIRLRERRCIIHLPCNFLG